MTIMTKKGDGGKTNVNGGVVDKDSKGIEVMGNIDELMAVLGIVMDKVTVKTGKEIGEVNRNLYLLMGEISGYGKKCGDWDKKTEELEKEIEKIEKKVGDVGRFLEVGGELEVWLNWARTVCRRVERRLVKYYKVDQGFDENILKYINRLSDYIFIKAIKQKR